MEKERNTPPNLFLKFFRWYCNPRLQDYIEGDLLEVYERRVNASGKRMADFRFILDVLLLCRPGIIKSENKSQPFYNSGMFKNNFKIAIRNLWKNKSSTVINVFGLTTGITSCLLIALFIGNEASFDQFQPRKEHIARVVMEYGFEGSTDKVSGTFTSTKVAPALSRTFPEVIKGVRMTDASMIVELNHEPITESKFLFADSSFFDVFYYDMVEGNAATALDGFDKVVLTESMAKKYFPQGDAVGKELLIGENKDPYEVTGVIRDYPVASQIQFDFIASFCSLRVNQEESWFEANYTTYLLLTGVDAFASLKAKLDPFMENEMKGTGASIRFSLEPFKDVHLYSPHSDLVPNTSIRYLYILGGIALLIIVIVCFTYINLSTAKSIERAREVGIRKVSGAMRGQLFWQFIGESLVLCTLSVLVSFVLASALLPAFSLLIDKNLQLSSLLTPSFILGVVAVTLLVSLIAGGYPALVLSNLQPARVLKGVFKNTQSAKVLQQSLTVFQFAITVFLIIATVVIQSQLHFIQNRKLGYDRDHIISMRVGGDAKYDVITTIKNELKTNTHIVDVTRCANSPVNISSGYSMRLPSMQGNEMISTNANPADEDYVSTTGLELVAGTNFSQNHISINESKEWDYKEFQFILNETAVKRLGFQSNEEAIGQAMELNRPGKIVGVMKDFNFQSLRNNIEPLVLFTATWGSRVLIKIKGDDMEGTLSFIEGKWKQLLPNRPFEYSFLDQEYERMYKTEQQLGQVMNLFAGIAIVLAGLGLFGLSSYMIQQRVKEISIRKVLGASLWSLLNLLSGNFVRLVLLSIVLAIVPAYLLMKQWLDGFVYRINLDAWIFIAAGLFTLVIAVITIGIHGMRAAVNNPVTGLRSE
ncbi:MAG TPA: ABC transporter permease [Cyclobacteriaceae bacterium]|nr:ABC transporter permease [Cyclobacteriaceae bacterium]HRF32514.1 ABC transporter permease [Cyclobacteriaceae bacterium]